MQSYSSLANKKSTTRSDDPLGFEGILQIVLVSVGAGEWLFVAAVCKTWQRAYLRVADRVVTGVDKNEWDQETVVHSAHMTLTRAALVSVSRMELAIDNGLTLHSPQLQHLAGRHADESVLSFAHSSVLPWTESVARGCADADNLAKLKWLHEQQGCPLPFSYSDNETTATNISISAASCGNVEMLKWLQQVGCEFNEETAWQAAEGEHKQALQYLIEAGCHCDAEVALAAMAAGNLDIVQFLHERNCPMDMPRLCSTAAGCGHIAALKWLQAQRPMITLLGTYTLVCAAGSGSIATCEYLRAQGCGWSTGAPLRAVIQDHAHVLRWLLEQGCDWEAETEALCEYAAFNGSLASLEYLTQYAAFIWTPELLDSTLNFAGAGGMLEIAQWLRQRGAEWPAVLGVASDISTDIIQWREPALQWARSSGCTAPLLRSLSDI